MRNTLTRMNSSATDQIEPELKQNLPRRVRLTSAAIFWLSVNFVGVAFFITFAFLGLLDEKTPRSGALWVWIITFGLGGLFIFALALRRVRRDYLLARRGTAQRVLVTKAQTENHGKAQIRILILSWPVGAPNLRRRERVELRAQEGGWFLESGDYVTLLYDASNPDDFRLYPCCRFRAVSP